MSSNDYNEENGTSYYEEMMKAIARRNGDLDRIRSATVNSKNTFSSDISSYSTGLSSLEDVPCTEKLIEYLNDNELNVESIIEDFDSEISGIDKSYS